ncbi:MAG: methionyl-tRNA formyltransferase [Clostridiales Family XIII bacterium]|nr:methionyl-tRNA formyltransferase [Clostridiales Family XIII bacterium]
MRIVYMGSPEFAVPALDALLDGGHEVVLAVTQSDKPGGRGKRPQTPPVKRRAMELGIPYAQPEKLRGNDEFREELAKAGADLFVVVAYGKILPPDILAIPRLGCVNIHASLLPKYRGAAPIQRAVMAGEPVTGVSLMYMTEEVDAGNVIATRRVKTGKKTSKELFDELAVLGAKMLAEELHKVEKGVKGKPQNHAEASYAPMIKKEEACLDFSMKPLALERIIRGMNDNPGAYAHFGDGKLLKIWEAEALPGECDAEFGHIENADDDGILIAAGGGLLLVKSVQAEGKKPLNAATFVRGSKMRLGDYFY